MNPTYTEFRFPQIKAHPWSKARHTPNLPSLPPKNTRCRLASHTLPHSHTLSLTLTHHHPLPPTSTGVPQADAAGRGEPRLPPPPVLPELPLQRPPGTLF